MLGTVRTFQWFGKKIYQGFPALWCRLQQSIEEAAARLKGSEVAREQVERLELKVSMNESEVDKLKREVEPEALQGISSSAELTAFIEEVLACLLQHACLLEPLLCASARNVVLCIVVLCYVFKCMGAARGGMARNCFVIVAAVADGSCDQCALLYDSCVRCNLKGNTGGKSFQRKGS